MKLLELKQIIREEIINALLEADDEGHPSGTAWKMAGSGWAAKNENGVSNYWYGKDETKNREAAQRFAKDRTRRKEPGAK